MPTVLPLRLTYRAPFDGAALLGVLEARAAAGLERVDGAAYARSLRLPHGPGVVVVVPGAGALRGAPGDAAEASARGAGVLPGAPGDAAEASARGAGGATGAGSGLPTGAVPGTLRVADARDHDEAVRRVRRLLDLDVDPAVVDAHLATDPALAPLVARRPGLRVLGAVDPFELALRAVIGQQVSVAAARTVLGRVVLAHGPPVPTGLDPADGLDPRDGLDPEVGLGSGGGLDPEVGLGSRGGLDPEVGLGSRGGLDPGDGLDPEVALGSGGGFRPGGGPGRESGGDREPGGGPGPAAVRSRVPGPDRDPRRPGRAGPGDERLRLLPAAEVVAELPDAALAMPRSRAATVRRLAAAVSGGELDLRPGGDPGPQVAALLELPGIGPWTAGYVAMRALGDRDAFPATDLVLRQGAAALGLPSDARGLAAYAARWSPWRAYAAQHLWAAAADARAGRR